MLFKHRAGVVIIIKIHYSCTGVYWMYCCQCDGLQTYFTNQKPQIELFPHNLYLDHEYMSLTADFSTTFEHLLHGMSLFGVNC